MRAPSFFPEQTFGGSLCRGLLLEKELLRLGNSSCLNKQAAQAHEADETVGICAQAENQVFRQETETRPEGGCRMGEGTSAILT